MNLHTEEERIITELKGSFFDTQRGILRKKTTIIDGQQYYKNVTKTDIEKLLRSAFASYRQVMREEIKSITAHLHYEVEVDDYDDYCTGVLETKLKALSLLQEKQPYNQRDHRHCYDDQEGHQNHPKCCLCSAVSTTN